MTTTQSGLSESRSGDRPRIGVSACLLGQPVRYDGAHKRNAYIGETLAAYFDYLPLCPEVAIGLGTPRPPIALQLVDDQIRARRLDNPQLDYSDELAAQGRELATSLAALQGYIFKSRSPSCAIKDSPIIDQQERTTGFGPGVYAAEILHAIPGLPVTDENELLEPVPRDHFLTRVYTARRWADLQAVGLSVSALLEFHARHKFLLLAHDERRYRVLGPLLASAADGDLRARAAEYYRELSQALAHPGTPGSHANALTHILGFLKHELDAGEKSKILAAIEHFRAGRLARAVPLDLLRRALRRHPDPYLAAQYYLQPYPRALESPEKHLDDS